MTEGARATRPIWDMLEGELIEDQRVLKTASAERSARGWAARLAKMAPGPSQRRAEAEREVAYWTERAERLRDHGFNPREREDLIQEYVKVVKKALSKGESVPERVIAQRSEFARAVTARERYEKGRHTSFANRSAGISERIVATHGVKVKRQDGKEIPTEQIQEIADGIEDLERAIGPFGDWFGDLDLTIAHTNGKHPFLAKSAGSFDATEGTASVGVRDSLGRPIASLAHELAGHGFDVLAGSKLGLTAALRHNRKVIPGLTDLSAIQSRETSGRMPALLAMAKRLMTDEVAVMKLLKRPLSDIEDERVRVETERCKVFLNAYYYQPFEIWARLVEQLIATRLGAPSAAAESPEWYQHTPGWWGTHQFETLRPAVEAEVCHRLSVLSGQTIDHLPAVAPARRCAPIPADEPAAAMAPIRDDARPTIAAATSESAAEVPAEAQPSEAPPPPATTADVRAFVETVRKQRRVRQPPVPARAVQLDLLGGLDAPTPAAPPADREPPRPRGPRHGV